jgi:hypothetical protein
MQRKERRSARQGSVFDGDREETITSEPVLVTVSSETAEKLRKDSEKNRIPLEILAAESIRCGMGVLAGDIKR